LDAGLCVTPERAAGSRSAGSAYADRDTAMMIFAHAPREQSMRSVSVARAKDGSNEL
jgi:hypothetical protein